MKKFIAKIILILSLFLINFWISEASINITSSKDYFENFWKEDKFIKVWDDSRQFAVDIANNVINIFFVIAIVYFFILVIKLIVSSDADEEHNNFKKGFIWISVWLMIMQMAKVYVNSIYISNDVRTNGSVSLNTSANYLIEWIIKPLTAFLETWASFLFVMIAIYAFYKLITSNWDDEAAKSGKMMIFYSICGFIIIKVATTLIKAVYGECRWNAILAIFQNANSCNHTANPEWLIWIIINIINWMNSFIWIWIVIMIVYAWLQLIFSKWDEEKITSWKKSLFYIFIGLGILVMNYLILTFFLNV